MEHGQREEASWAQRADSDISGGDGLNQFHPMYRGYNAISEDAVGRLYRGKSVVDNRDVALKVFTDQIYPAREQLGSEELSMVNIIGVREVLSAANGAQFAVMDMPGGICLERLLARQRTLPVAAAIHIALNVSLIVRALHVHNRVHGHVNANNVFLKRQRDHRIEVQLLYHELRGQPAMYNLAGYLSPEQVTSTDVLHPDDDYWAVTALLYYMLFGGLPFVSKTRYETIRRAMTEVLQFSTEFERMHPDLTGFLKIGLAKSPQDRFQSGRDINLALKSVLSAYKDSADSLAPADAVSGASVSRISEENHLRSVPAESFLDSDMENELRDTKPQPVVAGAYTPDRTTQDCCPPVDEHSASEPDDYFEMVERELRETRPAPARSSLSLENEALARQSAQPEGIRLYHDSMSAPFNTHNSPEAPMDVVFEQQVEWFDDNVTVIELQPEMLQYKSSFSAASPIPSINVPHWDAGGAKRSGRKKALAAIMSVLVLAAGLFIWFRLNPMKGGSPQSTVLDSTPVGSEERVAESPMAAGISGAPAPDGTMQTEPAPPEDVRIDIENLPSGAHITVNGTRANLPLTLKKSDHAVVLNVIKGDRILMNTTVIPDGDKTVAIMIAASKVKKAKQKKGGPAVESAMESKNDSPGSGKLSSNPYQLRKNPFSSASSGE
jgi:eukaryotic-like serine/threonine-protein kinase